MAGALALTLLQFAVAAGLGGLVARLVPPGPGAAGVPEPDRAGGWDIPRLLLAGVCLELTLLPLASFVCSMAGAARWLTAALAVAGFVFLLAARRGAGAARLLPGGGPGRAWAWLLSVLALALADAVAQTALGRPVLGDTGLYHLHSVRWAAEHPLVTGIANLHDRLGFNSVFFLHAALFDGLFFPGDSAWGAAAFFRLLAVAHLAFTALDQASPVRARAFAAAALPYVAWRCLEAMPSLGYDETPQLLALLAALELLRAPAARLADLGRAGCLLPCWLALWASVTALTVKLSMAPAVVFFGAPFLLAAWKGGVLRGRLLAWGLLPAVAAVAAYLGRNVLATGWLFYPVPVARLDVPWAVDRADLVNHTWNWILSWARAPGRTPPEVLGRGLEAWLPAWWNANRGQPGVQAVWWGLGVLGLRAALALAAPSRRKETEPGAAAGLLATLAGRVRLETLCALGMAASIVWWFLGAPDPRFIDVLQAGFLAACLALLASTGGILAAGLPTAALAAALAFAWLNCPTTFRADVSAPAALRDAFPRPAYETVTARGRDRTVDVLAPLDTDMCWNAPLPCTPYPRRIKGERIAWPEGMGRPPVP
ncbi:hypothetical protein NNJEOMEG_01507 [Fundidesulfovibrio magnetotacticus]|uniref:DUF8201 domain-containing protein n=1 Tax=Fundidesulfovibrio magnetotacticus TaxID=2730080 RepID=A0A6V8LLV8_9BACT|nr:hypothetical protein [Fundidesulfovibrio magnetotacticus]GFK93673.1 hypothetical protein NNJEOMEG_01507 [Fundidesulfovibrio magnetotacticus]